MNSLAAHLILSSALTAASAAVGSPTPDLTPKKLLEQAVAAHGGPDQLAEPPARILRGTASVRFRQNEMSGPSTLYREADRERSESTIVMRGSEREFLSTWDGAESWREAFGRTSEQPTRPAEVEAQHRPTAALLRALANVAEATLSTENGLAVIEVPGEDSPMRIGIDPDSGLVAYVEYTYPRSTGLAEIKLVKRIDRYEDWRTTATGFAVAHVAETELDGVIRSRFEVESVEAVDDLDDTLFRIEADLSAPLPGDELAE